MATTYDLIASQTLGSAAASITFSSIAASWTDLRLVLMAIGATDGMDLDTRLNGDSGTNYSETNLLGYNTTVQSTYQISATQIRSTLGSSPGVYTIPHLYTFDFFSYASSNYKTMLLTNSEAQDGTTQVLGGVSRIVGLWRSTSAITSISTGPTSGTGNFAAGTTAQLYGIKAA